MHIHTHTSSINLYHLKAKAIWGERERQGKAANIAFSVTSELSLPAAANKLFLLCRGTNEYAAVAS